MSVREHPISNNHESRHYIILLNRVVNSGLMLLNTVRFDDSLSPERRSAIEDAIKALNTGRLSCDEFIAEIRTALAKEPKLWRKFLGSLRLNTIWKDVAGDGSGCFP